MTNTTVLTACIVFLIGLFLYREISAHWKAASEKMAAEKAKREALAAEERLKETARYEKMISCMVDLTVALSNTSQNGVDATKLLAGTLKACESIASATVELKATIESFQKIVAAPKETGYPESNFMPPATEGEAERAAMTFESILRGIPVHQAEQEAADALEKKTMLSAISLGPED